MLFDAINRGFTSPLLDFLMWWLTMIGKPPGVWAAIALVLLLKPGLGQGARRTAWAIFFANLWAIPFEWGVKPLVGRLRPSDALEGARVIFTARNYSFPSGHALVAFACAAVLWRYDRRLGAAAYVLAALISYSRIYVGNHWPTDVAAGAAIGWLIGLLSCRFVDWAAGRMLRRPPAGTGA